MIEPSNADLGDTPDSVIEYMTALQQENDALKARIEELEEDLNDNTAQRQLAAKKRRKAKGRRY